MARLQLREALRVAPEEARSRGVAAVLRARRRTPFQLDGRPYRYFIHHYNRTWNNERTVEVSVAAEAIERRAGGNTLEIGNVLVNYLPAGRLPERRLVIDKYELAEGVVNVDVMDHEPGAPYDLIVSLSTMEHVGQDDDRHEPAKAIAAIERLHGWLAPGGELLVTVPLGHNAALDDACSTGRPCSTPPASCAGSTRRTLGARPDPPIPRDTLQRPFPFANAIAIGRSSG